MHTQTIQTSHTNTHTHTALPVRPLLALLSVAPPKQVTRNSSPERNSLPFLPPFLPNEPLSLCTCVTRCPLATRTTFTNAHYRFSFPPSPFPASYTLVGGWRGRGIQTAPRPSGNEPGESVAFSPHLNAGDYTPLWKLCTLCGPLHECTVLTSWMWMCVLAIERKTNPPPNTAK